MLVEQSRKVTWGQELMNRVWPVNTWFPTTQLDAEDHHTFYALCYDFFLAPYLIFFNLKNYVISSPWRVWTRYSFSPSSRRYDDKGDDDHRHHHPVNEIMKELMNPFKRVCNEWNSLSGRDSIPGSRSRCRGQVDLVENTVIASQRKIASKDKFRACLLVF